MEGVPPILLVDWFHRTDNQRPLAWVNVQSMMLYAGDFIITWWCGIMVCRVCPALRGSRIKPFGWWWAGAFLSGSPTGYRC